MKSSPRMHIESSHAQHGTQTSPMSIRAIIVDDVLLARKRVKRFLARYPDIELIGECSNGEDAVAAIRELRPNLLFLDVQMPEMDGFEVLEVIDPEIMPAVIFVTAYEQFALKAFDAHAIDYLLKPFNRERFAWAINRARVTINQRETGQLTEKLNALLHEVKPHSKFLKRVVVKSAGRTMILPIDSVDYIQAAGNYLQLHMGKTSHLIRERLSHFETKVDPDKFIRIHRSTIVNIERIKEMHPLFNGDQTVVLHDGTRLTMSRSYRERLLEILE